MSESDKILAKCRSLCTHFIYLNLLSNNSSQPYTTINEHRPMFNCLLLLFFSLFSLILFLSFIFFSSIPLYFGVHEKYNIYKNGALFVTRNISRNSTWNQFLLLKYTTSMLFQYEYFSCFEPNTQWMRIIWFRCAASHILTYSVFRSYACENKCALWLKREMWNISLLRNVIASKRSRVTHVIFPRRTVRPQWETMKSNTRLTAQTDTGRIRLMLIIDSIAFCCSLFVSRSRLPFFSLVIWMERKRA